MSTLTNESTTIDLMKPTYEVLYPKNHVEPYSFYLKSNEGCFALADIQIKAEINNPDVPDLQEHSLSVYLKPPIVSNYVLYSREIEMTREAPGKLRYRLVHEPNSQYFNPYISWHGSGTLHANAYMKNKKRAVRIVKDRPALSWRDVVMAPQHILRAIIPAYDISNAAIETDLTRLVDLTDLQSSLQHTDNPKGFLLDKKNLVTDSVFIDIFIHNRGYEIKNALKDIPFPDNTELIWLAPPLKFENRGSIFAPAVSIFIYQPGHNAISEIEQQPLILSGVSTSGRENDIYIQALLTR